MPVGQGRAGERSERRPIEEGTAFAGNSDRLQAAGNAQRPSLRFGESEDRRHNRGLAIEPATGIEGT